MKVPGINECYSVEIEKKEKNRIFITLRSITGTEMCVGISDKNWEKLKEMDEGISKEDKELDRAIDKFDKFVKRLKNSSDKK